MECGSVSPKNRSTVLAKNLLTFNLGFIAFWFVGYTISFGNVDVFLGFDRRYFASSGFNQIQTD
jgi:ammonia channel protein AmtB